MVDLPDKARERHSEPAGYGHRRIERARRGETLRYKTLPALVIPADAVLG